MMVTTAKRRKERMKKARRSGEDSERMSRVPGTARYTANTKTTTLFYAVSPPPLQQPLGQVVITMGQYIAMKISFMYSQNRVCAATAPISPISCASDPSYFPAAE